jgi:hypothetical protein
MAGADRSPVNQMPIWRGVLLARQGGAARENERNHRRRRPYLFRPVPNL